MRVYRARWVKRRSRYTGLQNRQKNHRADRVSSKKLNLSRIFAWIGPETLKK